RAKLRLTAWALRRRQFFHNFQRLRTELAYWNLIVWIIRARRIAQLSETAAAEVARKHASSWYKTRHIRRIGARAGSLIPSKEKEFAPNNGAAERSPVLVTLKRVPSQGVGISRVHLAVAEKLERVAVERIRPGLHDGADCPGRMQPVLRGQ